MRELLTGAFVGAFAVAMVAACGTADGEPFGDLGPFDATAPAVTATGPAVIFVDGGRTGAAAEDAAPSQDAAQDGSSVLAMCPSEYATLSDFLDQTACGACVGVSCATLTEGCFLDCSCISGALAVFSCAGVSAMISACASLAAVIPSQFQEATYECTESCHTSCVNRDAGTDASRGAANDSGIDAD